MKLAVFIAVPFIILLFMLAVRYLSRWDFSLQLHTLFSQAEDISAKKFHYNQLRGLPQPVQHYFRHVLKEGQPYISYVQLSHDGQFKTAPKKPWLNIQGEEFFTAARPGFLWRGRTSFFTATDGFIQGSGSMRVKLFSLLPIINGRGPAYDEGELLRWLGESVWFPTSLLPSENLSWLPVDSHTARLCYRYKNLVVSYTVTFNEDYEIVRMETRRHMGNTGPQKWTGIIGNYRQFHSIRIPGTIEALWNLDSGSFSYARFNLKNISYTRPPSTR